MKGSDQILREQVLRAVSDDYEEIERILDDVTAWLADRAIAVERHRVLRALEGLIEDGYVQPYVFPDTPPWEAEPVAYAPSRIDDLWFYVTSRGKQLALQLQEEWR